MTFVNYFGSIDSLLSRRRELRADRIAAESYGDQTFISALTKVTHSSLYYYRNVYNKIDQMHPEGNLFHHVHRQMGDRCEEIDSLWRKKKAGRRMYLILIRRLERESRIYPRSKKTQRTSPQ